MQWIKMMTSTALLSQALYGFGTQNSDKNDEIERYCSVRFFSVKSREQADRGLESVAQSYQDDLYLFKFKDRLFVGQYSMRPTCSELRDQREWFRTHGFDDAYFVNYRPKQSRMSVLLAPQKPVKKETQTTVSQENNRSDAIVFGDEEILFFDDVMSEEAPEQELSWYEQIETRGNMGLVYNGYSTDQTKDTTAVEGYVELKKAYDWGNIGANVALLYDFSDDRRRYLMMNELYAKYYDENMIHTLGRTIKNWGVLEAYSISDVFNTKNFLSDSFDMSRKYGALNYELAIDDEDAQYAIIVKFEEREQPYPAEDNVYNIYQYDKALETEKGVYYPSVYLRYSDYIGNDTVQSDYAMVLQHGYDNKRDMVQKIDTTYEQYSYRVNKAIAYTHVTFLDLSLKIEGAYTDVIDYEPMSDYLHGGIGLEYVPPLNIGGAELKLLSEYYRYYYIDKDKSEDVDFSELFNNDVFLGVNSNFGDAGSSEIKGGVALDIGNQEQVYALTFGTRLKENYRLWMEWKVFVPGNDATTAIGRMGQFNQVTFRANYFF
jgi:hypothetical protein